MTIATFDHKKYLRVALLTWLINECSIFLCSLCHVKWKWHHHLCQWCPHKFEHMLMAPHLLLHSHDGDCWRWECIYTQLFVHYGCTIQVLIVHCMSPCVSVWVHSCSQNSHFLWIFDSEVSLLQKTIRYNKICWVFTLTRGNHIGYPAHWSVRKLISNLSVTHANMPAVNNIYRAAFFVNNFLKLYYIYINITIRNQTK